ncbi:TetR family transcriptional regulator C-terminal domain-containing protein [Shewanella intestini]|uniref:TetR family transcriptional regulator n=1 Tax=Shewanella intestini TaxID=2017544 RepID=A0ABS5I3E7_9GAMM|nr:MULTISPECIES: TetR/AcrR family transcriptional regulator [Shewanella]MBR9728551.1 TetR family transcriptional regulator [Shewanella intestini]MRG36370.1 TetR family transcriptional regulator [Shewanella sp. XMDDZSB0408]
MPHRAITMLSNSAASTMVQARRGRPPKDGRQRIDTRSELIQSGLAVLTEKGFVMSGIDLILKQVRVPKGSFYYYFASKEAFGLAVIDSYASFFAHKLDKHLLNDAFLPLERIEQFAQSAIEAMARFEFNRGCLVGNLGQEVDQLPESFRPVLIDIFASWQLRLQQCLDAAIDAGQVAATANTQQLAEFFWIGWEGAVSRARLVKSAAPLRHYVDCFIAGLPVDKTLDQINSL